MKKNGIIDCWRILFALFVMMLHSVYLPHGENAMFKGGWISVEFFFVLSGFLMAKYDMDTPPRKWRAKYRK